MRIAALYDIHGNLPALDAVLDEIERGGGADLLVIGGDVYPGPMANEVLDRIRSTGIPFRAIAGNGERVVLETIDGTRADTLPTAAVAGVEWCARQLTREHESEIRGWPATLRLDVPAVGRVLFVHATPRNDSEIFTERTADAVLRSVFAGVDADIVACGHTHMQFDRRFESMRIVNAGSVGMPFEDPGAYWALIDEDVMLRRTEYDRAGAATILRQSSYPGVDQFVDQQVLTSPPRARMLDLYDRMQVS